MSANVIPFRKPAPRGGAVVPPGPPPTVTGLAIVLQVRGGRVVMLTDDVELELTPEQARDVGRDLLELADDAEARGRG